MILKNNSSKIIGIQETTILPGETAEIPKGYEKNPVVKRYISDGTFSEIKKGKAVQNPSKSEGDGDTSKTGDAGGEDNPQNPADDAKDGNSKK